MEHSEKIRAYSAWAAVSFFWGTTYLAIRIGVETLPPALFAGARFFVAGLIFLVVLRLKGYPFPGYRQVLDMAIVGIALLVLANGTVVWASQWVPSGVAALVVATVPFFMVGVEASIPGSEKVSWKQLLGILVGFGGLALLLWQDFLGSFEAAYLKGVMALLFAALSWGAGSIYSKYRRVRTAPLMAAALQMTIAGAILVLIGAFLGEFSQLRFETSGMLALLYLLIFGSIVGYGAYIYALDKLPTAFVSTYAYINPVIAVILGWLILGERLDGLVALSTAIILGGVVLVKSATPKKLVIATSLKQPIMEKAKPEVCS